jgi:hypothetical protein
LIILWSPFFILGYELVEKEIKRPSSLINLCSLFYMVLL